MATVLQMPSREPVHIGDALFALSCLQVALVKALPDAADVKIELTADHDGKGGLFRAVMTLKSLADPKETMFILGRDLVPGYKFFCVSHNVPAGSHKRVVVTAMIGVN